MSLPHLAGSYALLVIASGADSLIAARKGSPLVLGIGDKEYFAASDMTPIIEYTERAIFLEDGDIACLKRDSVDIYQDAKPVNRAVELIDWSPEEVRKGGFAHYMLKEIYEQPQAFFNTLRAVDKNDLPEFVCHSSSVTIVACGSSSVRAYLQIPPRRVLRNTCTCGFCFGVQVFSPPVDGLVIGITQSGETADTLTALGRRGFTTAEPWP